MQTVTLTVLCVVAVLGLALADYSSYGYGSDLGFGYGQGYGYGYAPAASKPDDGGFEQYKVILMILLFLTVFQSPSFFNFTRGSSSPSVTVVQA